VTPFAVVDVETTGFSPRVHDRMLEVAVVRLAPDGALEDEYATLLNPGRDMGATDVHGLTAADVARLRALPKSLGTWRCAWMARSWWVTTSGSTSAS
jgi:DNA polymerase III epsilon subunit-like protein